jgi:hypothetical protein
VEGGLKKEKAVSPAEVELAKAMADKAQITSQIF